MATKQPSDGNMPQLTQSQDHEQPSTPAKFACTTCARRKVGCDRTTPQCGNCIKHQAECRYEEPQPSQRQRKRKADVELIARITQLEDLLHQHSIDPGPGLDVNEFTPQYKTEEKQLTILSAKPPAKPFPFSSEKIAAENISGFSKSKLPSFSLSDLSCLKFMTSSDLLSFDPLVCSNLLSSSSSVVQLHPEPRHVFRLWQIFTERTNAIIKVLHAPSVQQRILDASWNIEACIPSFQALLFGIYLAAVTSMTTSDCLLHFSEDKNVLIHRYRGGAWQSLLAAGMLETRELEVLQALVIFLSSDPKSDSFTTLSALAVRIALKMGLDRESKSVSVFEQEMRIRLWWYLCTQDVLALYFFVSRDSPITDSILTPNVRLPLNVNDVELHPDMVKLPTEHPRATEMMYVLMRYEGATFGRRMRQKQKEIGLKHFPFEELEQLFEDKYLRHADVSIPLHAAAQAMARYAMAGIRYRLAHFNIPDGSKSDDSIFDRAVGLLELNKACSDNHFAKQLLWHNNPSELDAVIYVLSRLRLRQQGERVTQAWELVVHFWNEHIEPFLEDNFADQGNFFASLADLTLEAWRERKKQLIESHGPTMAEQLTPPCIDQLRKIRRTKSFELQRGGDAVGLLYDEADTAGLPSDGLNIDGMSDMYQFGSDFIFDFGFWSEFAQMPGL